jgi:hypothetical protein
MKKKATKNWFWPSTIAQFSEAGKKSQQNRAPARKQSNKYDLTAVPCFSLAHHNDWSRWFVISSPLTIYRFRFMGGIEINK